MNPDQLVHHKSFLLKIMTVLVLSLLPMAVYADNGEDSVKIKKVRRYIRPCIYFNHYGTPKNRNHLKKEYRFAQNDLGFYMPLYTNTWLSKDNVSLSTLHILGTIDLLTYKPNIAFLNESYRIVRASAGVRIFYSSGNRDVFYFSVNPFLSQDQDLFGKAPVRISAAFIYSRTVSKNFAFRLGIARSYTYGRALPIPVVGFRIGALDQLHLNLQLPKNISLNFPMGKNSMGSVFTKSMGGVYNVVTQDTILTSAGEKARLRRYELLHGMQFNFRTSKNFSFYIATGFTTRRTLRYVFEDPNAAYGYDIKRERIPSSIFINAGLSIRLGRAKKVYNNTVMYDVMNLNTINNAGLNETGPMDNDIPAKAEKYKIEEAKKVKYKDVEDLIMDEY